MENIKATTLVHKFNGHKDFSTALAFLDEYVERGTYTFYFNYYGEKRFNEDGSVGITLFLELIPFDEDQNMMEIAASEVLIVGKEEEFSSLLKEYIAKRDASKFHRTYLLSDEEYDKLFTLADELYS